MKMIDVHFPHKMESMYDSVLRLIQYSTCDLIFDCICSPLQGLQSDLIKTYTKEHI